MIPALKQKHIYFFEMYFNKGQEIKSVFNKIFFIGRMTTITDFLSK